ncbi:MAG: carbohydrate kinase [Phycisphaerae bacterium]|nr:carbohydrate kinase [Saprospiraceae bacterium]
MRRTIDILSAGELLVDFITAEFVQTLDEGMLFKRIPSGNPATLAINMARLGNKAMLAATVGNDDMGGVLINHLNRSGVDTSCVAQVEDPTTLILATRSATAANLQVYRGADSMLSIRQFPFQSFDNIGVFHTTCFALSKNPSQHVILQAAERAQRAGCLVSIDVNYSNKIFPDRIEAKKAVSEICRYKALIKISDADWKRLYEDNAPAPEAVIEHFMKIGASQVCFATDKGYWVGNGSETHSLPHRQEAAGTGDAFLAGYLTAYLDEKSILDSAVAGRRMAELKVSLSEKVDRSMIYEELE